METKPYHDGGLWRTLIETGIEFIGTEGGKSCPNKSSRKDAASAMPHPMFTCRYSRTCHAGQNNIIWASVYGLSAISAMSNVVYGNHWESKADDMIKPINSILHTGE